ncbi:N-acetylglucosamine-6-phosphate deacetylase [Verminephrobacter aporrectodeae]|uniref:N-acetylglucosamine-6-phosphate deacetylase n=1 Tax=Verminephrobacter aporrectodeae TaxID=1110389 RepID=UPI0022386634|nr:amidohydrolase family protein [Verminephrobacter aporrectodeae]
MAGRVSAGLFDVQVNGFSGVDFNDARTITGAALDHALGAMLATGVTACLPTIITAAGDAMSARLQALDRALRESRLGAAMIPGYHLEGPFLNPLEGYAGCHPAEAMRRPDAQWISRIERALSRPILMLTYAPELDESGCFAKSLHAQAKVLAIGHSAADAETIDRATHAGARLCTHLGNGVPQLLPKFNNTIQAQLGCDGLCASFIADGLHVPPRALRSMLRAKGLARSILVTDAVSAAGAARPGSYRFAGFDVELGSDGAVRTPGSAYLAGSSLTLDRALRNAVAWGCASFEEAIAMASENPRRILADAFQRHGIALPPSEVEWSDALEVHAARVGDHRCRAQSSGSH